MNKGYYTLPIAFHRIIERKELSRCDLQASIAQNIHLLLVTSVGESRYNSNLGNLVWESDFENIYNLNAWTDRMAKAIALTLKGNEPRLTNVTIQLEITQEETSNNRGGATTAIRKRLDMRVAGNLQKTNEPFVFSEPIYLSPISFD
jgi:phage baseplate assembly protein W